MSTKQFIYEGKSHIKMNSIKELNLLVNDITIEREYKLNYAYIFKEWLLYASKNGTIEILIWFIELYYELDIIEQTALRQVFFYAKHLAKKNRCVPNDWFDNNVIPLIRC